MVPPPRPVPRAQEAYIHSLNYLSGFFETIRDLVEDEYIVWPELRSLTLSVSRLSNPHEIVQFVKGRIATQLPLQAVTLTFDTTDRPAHEMLGGGDWIT